MRTHIMGAVVALVVLCAGVAVTQAAQEIWAMVVTQTILGDMKPEVSVLSLYPVPVPQGERPQDTCAYTQHYVELAMAHRYAERDYRGQIEYHCVRLPQVQMLIEDDRP